MKIQSTSAKNISKRKKATNASDSGQFQALFSQQTEQKSSVQARKQAFEQPAQQAKQQPIIEDALNTLEQAMLQLDEGETMSEQALAAIHDLRLALHNNPQQLSTQATAEADTLLAVEAKRLERLNKI